MKVAFFCLIEHFLSDMFSMCHENFSKYSTMNDFEKGHTEMNIHK